MTQLLTYFHIGLTTDKIDSVELVGEATRIPCCIQQIKEVFNQEPSRTLNSTDCIARGCALQAAMLSPSFQTAAYEMTEYNSQPVSITYKFKDSDKVVTKELFKKGSNFPNSKNITFNNKQGNMDLMIHYGTDAQLMEGISANIAQYDITEGTIGEKTEKHSF